MTEIEKTEVNAKTLRRKERREKLMFMKIHGPCGPCLLNTQSAGWIRLQP